MEHSLVHSDGCLALDLYLAGERLSKAARLWKVPSEQVLSTVEAIPQRRAIKEQALGSYVMALAKDSDKPRSIYGCTEQQYQTLFVACSHGLPIGISRVHESGLKGTDTERFTVILKPKESKRGRVTFAALSECVQVLKDTDIPLSAEHMHSWKIGQAILAFEWLLSTHKYSLPKASDKAWRTSYSGAWFPYSDIATKRSWLAYGDEWKGTLGTEHKCSVVKPLVPTKPFEWRFASKPLSPDPVRKAKKAKSKAKPKASLREYKEIDSKVMERHSAALERGCNPACEHYPASKKNPDPTKVHLLKAARLAALWNARSALLAERSWLREYQAKHGEWLSDTERSNALESFKLAQQAYKAAFRAAKKG